MGNKVYSKKQTIIVLLGIFVLSVLVRTVIGGFEKHILVIHDELIYYSYAENLAKGNGFPVIYNQYANYEYRWLYSLLISPAFLVSNRTVQFVLVALINNIILSSGILPVYLLAKDVIDKKWAIFCCVVFVLLPDMVYGISFMTDGLLYIIALWLILFSYRLLDISNYSSKYLIKNGVGLMIAVVAGIFTKKSVLLIVFAASICLFLSLLKNGIKNEKSEGHYQKLVLKTSIVAFAIFLLLLMLYKTGLGNTVISMFQKVFGIVWGDGKEYLRYYFYYIMQILVAAMFFPIILPYIYGARLDQKAKRLLLLMTMILIGFTLVTNTVSYGFQEIARVHLRYIIFIWIPYYILFCKVLESIKMKNSFKEWIGWGIAFVFIILICIYYYGPQKASVIEETLLYWVEEWQNYRAVYIVGVLIFFVLSFALLHKKMKLFAIFFFSIAFLLQGYNNIQATSSFKENYMVGDTDIDEIESYVREHKGEVFLILDLGEDRTYEYDDINYMSSKMADTYLSGYSNVLRGCFPRILTIQTETPGQEYRINEHAIAVYLARHIGFSSDEYDNTEVDYLILPVQCGFVDENSAEKIEAGNGDWFNIYRLKDKTIIPQMKSIYYLTDGHNEYGVENGLFFSQYMDDDGNQTFTSSSDYAGHVLYGPYITLAPGDYNVTVRFEYIGDETEERIGVYDLNGAGYDFSKVNTEVYANENAASLSFSTDVEINNFEIRLYAEKAGIKVKSVDIEKMGDKKGE